MRPSRELFEHLQPLLPSWKVRRGHCGANRLVRSMVYTVPGPTYHPDPTEGSEHSLRLVILLPTDIFDEYEVFLVPLRLWNGKFLVKDGAFYLRYNTDYISKLAARVITLPRDTPLQEVAKKAASFFSKSYDNVCAHFLKSHILGEQKTRPVDHNMVARYVKRLAVKGFGEDAPPWFVKFYPYSYGGDVRFDTNIMGSEKQWSNVFKRVQITGILTARAHTDWHGDQGVQISCFVSAYEPGHRADWPWKMPACHTFLIRGMPNYQGFKLAARNFMENRIKSRYRYARKRSTFVVWDDTLPEGVTPPALLKRETA